MSSAADPARTSWTGRRGPLLTLSLIVGVSPFATDMYIPGLPAIARDLDVSTAAVQLSLTAFLVAFTLLMMWAAAPIVWAMTGGFPDGGPEKLALAVDYTRITFPYLMLISLVSLLGGILNSVGRFWVNAAAPILLPVLVSGLIIGMIQAATSINEATLSFVPKLIVVAMSILIFGSLILGLLSDFTIGMFERIPDLVK